MVSGNDHNKQRTVYCFIQAYEQGSMGHDSQSTLAIKAACENSVLAISARVTINSDCYLVSCTNYFQSC